ncbi:MAG: hypothetical protein CMP22_01440 [Rickettsiales bacterium]|nr:hypothetical protein [Rickettsiales bacterium]|tara:strand:+ start:533 stop:874 length:342 start_codon:yes stop_codon:yes gene_type:complete
MAVTGVNNYIQAAQVRAPAQDSVAFKEQNTQKQKADSERVQPFEAESSQTIATDGNFRKPERVNAYEQAEQVASAEGQEGSFAASSSNGQSEDISVANASQNSQRGSFVDILV